ncbi:MAG: 50S ribosomal protein L15 [Candidatus Woykebacteria bacterium RBG_16_39_9b]|uniref:Large ribosomal subunit protein uL15 n=1 Tax=Candidatus Woykebacteria bacterium RBG_16_39_9b TaxID=1802595 RepID=A0A1G1WDG8_9BACT|nr:MAG: 50S ribosomal protein L15 [Candidatus Woykebacteria bacterium RBG_16_39_9b]
MELSKLSKIKTKSKKRIGRGESSGKGKTSGRGHKGQRSRGKIKLGFEGGQLALSKRLPQRRGIGNPPSKETVSIKVGWLSKFKPNSVVDKDSLIKIGLVKNSQNIVKIKIVDGGVLKVPVVVKVPVSSKARSVIEKALGKVELANG